MNKASVRNKTHHCGHNWDHNATRMNNLTNINTRADVKVGNGLIMELAAEAPEDNALEGPFAEVNPGNDPVEGTTEDLGFVGPPNSDWGDGAGANSEILGTVVGGATSAGNSCGPAELFKIELDGTAKVRSSSIRGSFLSSSIPSTL